MFDNITLVCVIMVNNFFKTHLDINIHTKYLPHKRLTACSVFGFVFVLLNILQLMLLVSDGGAVNFAQKMVGIRLSGKLPTLFPGLVNYIKRKALPCGLSSGRASPYNHPRLHTLVLSVNVALYKYSLQRIANANSPYPPSLSESAEIRNTTQ